MNEPVDFSLLFIALFAGAGHTGRTDVYNIGMLQLTDASSSIMFELISGMTSAAERAFSVVAPLRTAAVVSLTLVNIFTNTYTAHLHQRPISTYCI